MKGIERFLCQTRKARRDHRGVRPGNKWMNLFLRKWIIYGNIRMNLFPRKRFGIRMIQTLRKDLRGEQIRRRFSL